MLAPLFDIPYFAVVFASLRTDGDRGYNSMAGRMDALAREQPGYLGIDSARSEIGITVSYWRDLQSIAKWKANVDHLAAQSQGREEWYQRYTVRICRVEREYEFGAGPNG